jgi:hypothetical protein
MRGSLTEDEQHKIAGAIVGHLEQKQLEDRARAGLRGSRAAPRVQVMAAVRGNLAIPRMLFKPLFHHHGYCSCRRVH